MSLMSPWWLAAEVEAMQQDLQMQMLPSHKDG